MKYVFCKRILEIICISLTMGCYATAWNMVVVDECVLNCWVALDGQIKLSGGIVLQCASEDELAALVAHEKAHLVLKHGERTWYEKLGGWFASWFVDESKPRFRGPPDPKSVERENEADEKGLMLMAEAGYDPQAAVDFWTRYYERTGWWEGDGTHPKPRERLAHLNALMPKAKETYWSACSTKAALASTTTKKGAQ